MIAINNNSRRWIRIATATLGLTLLASLPAEARKKKKPEADPAVESALPTIAGPKRTVAVAGFNAQANFLEEYGEIDVGGGLAAMLATALVKSGQFIVVERAALGATFAEQELAAGGGTAPPEDGAPEDGAPEGGAPEGGAPEQDAPEQGAPAGQLTNAQLLIVGSVTEFNQNSKGKNFGIGIGGFGLNRGYKIGTVGMDIRVIDTLTSEIVSSYLVRESVKSKSLNLSLIDEVDLFDSNFQETSLGQAARKAIDAAVRRFAEEAAARPWTGQVVDFDQGVVAINAGASSGIRVGDSFDLFRVIKVLTDPVTGRIIGRRQRALGLVVIAEVADGVAFGSFRGQAVAPRRGDLVTQH